MSFRLFTIVASISMSVSIGYGQHKPIKDDSYELYLTQIAAAEAFLQLNKVSEADKYLNACNEKYRGLEWRFLKAALDQSSKEIHKREGTTISDVKISPDGKFMAAAGSDSLITIYSYPGFKKIIELSGHKGAVSTIDFSKDGKRLASGGRDHAVIIWDVATGKQLVKNDSSFTQGIYQVRFNNGDKILGVVSWERLAQRPPHIFGFVKLLDAVDASEQSRIELDNHPAAGIVFTPDGKDMIISTWGEITYSFDISSSRLNWKYDLSDPSDYNAFHSIDINPSGDQIALGSTDHQVHILGAKDGKLLHKIEPWVGHTKIVKAVSFSHNGRWLASAGEDQTVLIWDTKDFAKSNSLKGHVNTVSSLSWTKDNAALLSSSLDGSIKMWDLKTPFETSYKICDFGPWQTPISSDKTLFAAPCSDKKLVVYSASDGRAVKELGAQSGLCGVLTRDSKFLITASFDGVVRLWDLVTSKQIQAFSGHRSRVDGVAYKSSTREILSVGDSTLRVWKITDSVAFKIIRFNSAPFRIVIDQAETRAYVGFNNGTVRVVDTRSWEEVGRFECNSGIQEVSVSADGKMFAAFCGSKIEIWDTRSATRRSILSGHEKSGYGLCFSDDGKYLISGSYDQTFKLWYLTTGACTLTYHGFENEIYNCKFLSPDKIFLSSSQGKVWVYKF